MDMGELNPVQKKGVSQILKSGKHLLDLINEVLDMARIEAGRLTVSPSRLRFSVLFRKRLILFAISLKKTRLHLNQILQPPKGSLLRQIISV